VLNPYSSKILWIFDSNFVLDLSAICFYFSLLSISEFSHRENIIYFVSPSI
jgi:hypothetical protein